MRRLGDCRASGGILSRPLRLGIPDTDFTLSVTDGGQTRDYDATLVEVSDSASARYLVARSSASGADAQATADGRSSPGSSLTWGRPATTP